MVKELKKNEARILLGIRASMEKSSWKVGAYALPLPGCIRSLSRSECGSHFAHAHWPETGSERVAVWRCVFTMDFPRTE